MIPPTLAAAQADVLVKRARLKASLAEAKYRLSPATIASGVADDLRDKAEEGVAIVRQRPGIAAGVATGIVALLARKRIMGLFRKAPPPPPPLPPTAPNKE